MVEENSHPFFVQLKGYTSPPVSEVATQLSNESIRLYNPAVTMKGYYKYTCNPIILRADYHCSGLEIRGLDTFINSSAQKIFDLLSIENGKAVGLICLTVMGISEHNL